MSSFNRENLIYSVKEKSKDVNFKNNWGYPINDLVNF